MSNMGMEESLTNILVRLAIILFTKNLFLIGQKTENLIFPLQTIEMDFI